MSISGYVLINTVSALESAAQALTDAPAIAVDTEFVRRTTFHARPGLLQLSAGHGEYLVDLVALPRPDALRELFLSARPLKVMHSCGEDLEVLRQIFGDVPGSLVDTQVAAALLGHPLQLSYQKLARELLDVDVPKDETCSDWCARPLSDAQLEYAALDVRYLLTMWHRLAASLSALGRSAWLDEECARLLAAARHGADPTTAYRNISNAWRLDPEALARLARLVVWREQMAREQDKPRSHIVSDVALFAIAQRAPDSLQALRSITDLHPSSLRRYGDALLAQANAPAAPVPGVPPPLPREARGVLGRLKDLVAEVAAREGLASEVLIRRRHIESVVESLRDGDGELPSALCGWRRHLVGEPLLAEARRHVDEIRTW